MGFDTSGYVLKSARSAPSNATSTAGADSGVLREHADLPLAYTVPGEFVEVAADQYRSTVLDNPETATQEYLLWAANSSNLAVLEDASWAIDQGSGSIPVGTTSFSVGPVTYTDGTSRVVVTDDGGRSIAAVLSVTIVRGDAPATPVIILAADFASQDADAGVVVLSSAALASLGGGLSVARGDTVSAVSYYLAAQKFWWTRNDAYLQRFGWDGATQRWRPYRGGPPVALGTLKEDGSYVLVPRPSRFQVGDVLPYDSSDADAYAMVRVGTRPDAGSDPVRVLVVSDEDATSSASFPGGADAVVGVTSGVLRWNPLVVAGNAGRAVWYVPETFAEGSTGEVGPLATAADAPLFIAPIPGPTDYPFVRIGSRRPLQAVAAETDAALASLVVAEGQVGWSRTTGKLKFSAADVAKADPDDPGFDLLYLGAAVVYDGVSLTRVPVGTRAPVQVVDATGTPTTVNATKELYVPASAPLPSPGVSGVMMVPDGTGTIPNMAVYSPGTRPNGSGLVRQVSTHGDLVVFGKGGCIESVSVVEFDSELPLFPFLLPKGKASIAVERPHVAGSRLAVGLKDRKTFAGEPLYFLQAVVQPAVYTTTAEFFSKVREPFFFDGTEVLAFAVDGTDYLWSAASLPTADSYDAETVAASIDAVITGTGSASAVGGRVRIAAGDPSTGVVEIGFGSITSGSFADRDLSGCAALGFPPGWRAVGGAGSWLPDAGLSFGVFRSPQNLDRSQDDADFMARGRFTDAVFSRSVIASPVFLLNNVPLLDVAGYDEGVFFQVIDGQYRRSMNPFEDVLYDFENGRFSWLEAQTVTLGVSAPASSLPLDATGVVGLTLHPSVAPGYGFYLDESGAPFVLQVLGEDYLLERDGAPGTVTLIERVGASVATGGLGSFSAGGTTFVDADATFLTDGVVAGYRLKVVSGPDACRGSYVVASVTGETTLEVDGSVPFPVDGETVAWEVFEGEPVTGYDPGLLADVVYEQFDHLPEEPFQVRVLSPLGATPADAAEQGAGRLQAVVADAVAHGRPMSVRFGQGPDNESASVAVLSRTKLGTLANGTLVVPDVDDPHFVHGAFALVVGSQTFTLGDNLVGVPTFSDPVPDGDVEYGVPGSAIEGQVKFSADTLTSLEASLVYYVQTFTDPDDLDAGVSEVDPTSGDLNLSSADMEAHAGEEAYFVERMITEDREDVVISPLHGALLFRRPLRAQQLVEVSYYQADTAGNQVLDADGDPTEITEFLPLFVRLEAASAVTTTEYAFNSTGRTVRDDVPTRVYVDNRLQNYGNVVQATVDTSESVVRFASPITTDAAVQVSYAVNETFGGETAFTVSTPPVYRPPFFLEAGEGTFELETDRTDDMVPGKLLRVGSSPFYVKAATYDAASDTTSVTLFPTPDAEAGSRAPGNDVLTLVTSVPVTTNVDGEATGGEPGFLLTLSAPYEPVDAGMLSIVFRGDVRRFTVAGHLIEVGGYPLISAGSTLSDDGLFTRVNVTSPFLRGFDPTVDVVKVSARPIYPPDARNFVGLGQVVETEPVELVLYGEVDANGEPLPGRTLVKGRDYDLNPQTGVVTLLAPNQAPLAPGQRLSLAYTHLRPVAPLLEDGMVVVPRYRAGFAHVTTPSAENGFLDAYLVGTYSFASPDTFYVRTVPLTDYLGEVAQVAADRVKARTPHGGPVVVSGPAQENWSFGTIPVRSQERELLDQDRAARVFISLYDSFVQAFEQVKETMLGDVVGDRDGKFRFFVGRGKVYPGPGYEDPITGQLVPRFVWSQVFEAANGSFGVVVQDPIVDPATATQDASTLVVSGSPMNPWLLDFYVRQQRAFVLNDMDDLVLTGKDRAVLSFPYLFKVLGEFKPMWRPSVVSRLYPESTLAFTTTYPGLLAGTLPGEPGVYAFLKMLARPSLMKGEGPVFGSTFGMDIADVSNPALGLIQNITGQVRPRARLARARVWAYSSTGFPEIDPATDGKPSVIATPLLLREFPVDPETGLPDVTRFAENGGDLQDLSTGDYALSTPPWLPYDAAAEVRPQVAFGRPSGETYSVGYMPGTIADAFSGAFPFTTPIYKGIYVGGRYQGCVLTFTDGSGSEITDPSDIVRIGEDGTTVLPFEPQPGDTIYVVPPGSEDASGFANPPSVADLQKFARQQPTLDVGVRERRSAFVDLSLPSAADPSFPIKEIVNQRTASPLQPIEADVEFVNSSRVPLEFPALTGQPTNDSGDYTLPYLTTPNTEVERLGDAQATFVSVVQTDGPSVTHAWLAVYPDEVVGNDGSVLATATGTSPPAALLTARDLTPVATAGSYTPHSGVGDVRAYDLLLVEKGQADVAAGAQGILSVGAATSSTVEPPRFVTPTSAGTRIRYRFSNAMVHLSTTGTSGVVLQENGGLTTTLDISTVGGLFLNDGSGATTGGLNNIVDNATFAYPNGNVVTLDVIDRTTGLVLETVVLAGANVTGGLGTVAMGAMPTFSNKVLTINAVGFLDFAALGGASPGPVGPFDFRVTVDTFVTGLAPATGSDTAYVDADRLTFVEAMDLRTVLPRGSATVGGVSVQGELSVFVVTASGVASCIVNHPTVVNGGDPFTFLARDAASPNDVGTFDPSPGTGLGSVKAMAFEGHNNTPLPSAGTFTFSAIPSSDQDADARILVGTGSVADTGVAGYNPAWITGIVAGGGTSVANVEPGDVVVVTASAVGDATTKAGSYLVRHAVDDPSGLGYAEVFASARAGTSTSWLRAPFPTVVTSGTGSLTISSVQSVPLSPTTHDWASSGRVYLFVTSSDITQTISRAYTAVVVNADGTATFALDTTNTTGRDATGAFVSDADFDTAASASEGKVVSGMVYLPVGRFDPTLPANNVVGHDNGGATIGGFVDLTYENGGSSFTFSTGADLVLGVPAVDQVGVLVSDSTNTSTSVAFVSDAATPVYLGVPVYVDLRGLADPLSTTYATLHPTATAVRCVAPGDVFLTHDGSSTPTTGFRAEPGVFVEPSFPRPTLDLGNGEVKVVDAGTSALGTDRVGMRSASTYLVASPEAVTFEVRRIRRFHSVLDGIGTNLAPLRFAYEIRTGTVASYTATTRVLVATGTGTQLGGFTNPDVNINAGDEVRLVDASGTVLDTAEVAVVVDDTRVKLRSPGFAVSPPSGGETFQVFLRQAPVPHAQSNERLLELITDQVVLARTADPVADTGGRADVVNEFRDNSIPDFSQLDPVPTVGDIVLVDPAGALAGPSGSPVPTQHGSRPIGDQSVSTRTDGSHVAGGPSDLDDNRGWYRIVEDPRDTVSYLALSGETGFTGPDGAPVILGAASPTNQQFVVVPDITGSGLTGSTEGQMDFRPTKKANPSTNSYEDGSFKSIEPISYRILRPTPLVSIETVDLVLFIRERMLSWMEELAAAMGSRKQGSYYVFQRDEHVEDLGSATDGDDGLGVPSNVYVSSVSGLTQFAPFANTSDCLSVLDRRAWCLDTRLDREYPPYGAGTDPYTSLAEDASTSGYTVGSGRPAEPDLVDEVLDRTDRLRALRYSWIKFRANQDNGTLPSIDRFREELPRLIQEQADLLRLQQSIKDAE